MVRCPSCGRENEAHYRFCLGCGRPLSPGDSIGIENRAVEVPEPTPVARLGVLGRSPGEQPLPPSGPAPSGESKEPSGSRPCQRCGHPVAGGFTFCGHCGARHAPANEEASPRAPDRVRSPGGLGHTRPRKATEAWLVQIRSDGSEGKQIPISEEGLRIGRTLGEPLFEGDPFLSPLHASFRVLPDGLMLRDERSLNGTFIRVQHPYKFRHGDVIRIGQELLRFEEMKPDPKRTRSDGTLSLGSPTAGIHGRLCLLFGPDLVGDIFLLSGPMVRIGRERGDILFPDDGFVSGLHAEISFDRDRATLRDLGSSNGSFIQIRGEQRVRNGDFLLFGQRLFLIRS